MLLNSAPNQVFAAGILFSALFILPACSNSVADKTLESPSSEYRLQVRAVPVKADELQRNVESVGSLFALEEVTVSSEVDGRVDEVLVDIGDHVERGQPLVNVSTTELKLALDQQRALYQQARARLGITVESDDLKNVIDAAEVKKAAADLKEAQEIYKRSQMLLEKQLLPRQDFDQTEARMHAATAAYDLAVQSVQNLRAQLPQYRAAVELAEKKLRDAVIRAPFKGQVKERLVAPGQYLKVQTPVVVIVSIDPLRVRLKIPEMMAGWIRSGEGIHVSVEAYPDKTFSGKRERVLTVPRDSLQYSYGVYKVCLIQGDVLKETEVKIGELEGEEAEIVSGVGTGDMIAVPVKGQVLRDGARIQIVQ